MQVARCVVREEEIKVRNYEVYLLGNSPIKLMINQTSSAMLHER